jgi:hypothetical protein
VGWGCGRRLDSPIQPLSRREKYRPDTGSDAPRFDDASARQLPKRDLEVLKPRPGHRSPPVLGGPARGFRPRIAPAPPPAPPWRWRETRSERDVGWARNAHGRYSERVRGVSGCPRMSSQGSPVLHVRADAPPFIVLHGARDTMLLVEKPGTSPPCRSPSPTSRSPTPNFRAPSTRFDGFQSVRCGSAINGMEWFTAWVRTTRLRVV